MSTTSGCKDTRTKKRSLWQELISFRLSPGAYSAETKKETDMLNYL